MYTFLIVLIVLAAFLLGLVVLMQNSKGGGLSSTFASSSQFMGVRKTADFLEKATWGLAIGIVVLCFLSGYFVKSASGGSDQPSGSKAASGAQAPSSTIPDNTVPMPGTPESE
ncbi:MAG: preprotein translocase subunit SecG [Bacteroidales bacterium]|jgi:preprotein translocase subunit SecG|nr:preprotein translocase subunit SecG [Bacteroidales bacterium]